jgi:hypothetical protein
VKNIYLFFKEVKSFKYFITIFILLVAVFIICSVIGLVRLVLMMQVYEAWWCY